MTDKTIWASEPAPWTAGDPLDDMRRFIADMRAERPPPPPIVCFTRPPHLPLERYAEGLEKLAGLAGWRVELHSWIEALQIRKHPLGAPDECDAVEHRGVLFISPRLARVFPRPPT